MPIPLIMLLFENLEKNKINYVHWKSNINLNEALRGVDDLDILVDPRRKKDLERIFKELNIFRGYSNKDAWQDAVMHYYGLDEVTKKVIHIHLHYQLPVGYDYNKNFVLPINDSIFQNRIKKFYVYISCPEHEYILLVLRTFIKNALTSFLLSAPGTQLRLLKSQKIVTGGARKEFNDLFARVDRDKLKQLLTQDFPNVNLHLFEECEQAINQNASFLRFINLARKIKASLAAYKENSEIKSFFYSFIRITATRIKKIKRLTIGESIKGTKTPAYGGRIIAFIGGDGAGKSTNIVKLQKTLSRHFKTTSIHLGKPPKSILGFMLYYSSRALRAIGLTDLASTVMSLRLAIDRKKTFKKAQKLREKGILVILDRMPTKQITIMDAPRIDPQKYPRLSRFERSQYRSIKGCDLYIVLKLDPNIALERRPEDNKELLLKRSGQVWSGQWDKEYQVTINTGENSFEEVERKIVGAVFKSITTSYRCTELIGLSGVGKSTATEQLKIYSENLKTNLGLKDDLSLACLFLIKNPMYLIYKLSKRKPANKLILLRIEYFKLWLAKTQRQGLSSNFCFDQGPIFLHVYALKEGLISSTEFLTGVNKYADIFQLVYHLEASSDILYERIKTRKDQGKGRAKDLNREEFLIFHNSYQEAFEQLNKSDLRIIKINSMAFSPKELGEQIWQV